MTTFTAPELLVVDDNPGDLVLIEELISEAFQSGARVTTAATLLEALECLKRRASPLILLDLALPDSWGSETYRTVRQSAPEAVIVVLSGNTDETVALGLVGEGAQDYLVKGQFNATDLRRVIQYGLERSRIDRELNNQRASWEALIQAIPDGVIIADQADRIRFANPAALRLLGRTEADLFGTLVAEIHPADQIDLVRADLQTLRGSSESMVPLRQLPVLTPAGKEVPCEIVRSAFKNNEGVVTVSLIRDISPRRNLEKQLLHTQKMEALGQLTAGIAHDFNNILAVALGNLDLLARQVSADPAAMKRVGTATGAIQRGANLTKKLLSFSRAQDLSPSKIPLKTLVTSFTEMATRTIGPNIRVETAIPDDLPDIFVDGGELEQVLLNLTVNAKDAMGGRGRLIFEAEMLTLDESISRTQLKELAEGSYVVLIVTDTGVGMAKEIAERAFEPFFTTKETGKGTGLGLSMVYGFMKQSGGTAKIYSESGVGTSFRLYFPVADATTSQTESRIPAAKHFAAPGARALVVDDEPALLEVASRYLQDWGYQVRCAESGDAALAVFESEGPFSLLLSDILMPGNLNGVELAQKVRALDPNLRVVFTSGFPARALEGRQLLPDSVLVAKPYAERDLNQALAQVFGR